MRIFNRVVICAMSATLLTGLTTDNAINNVKGSNYPDESSRTIGDVLDNRKMCSTSTWEVIEGKGDDVKVFYRCKLSKFVVSFTERGRGIVDQAEKNKNVKWSDAYKDQLVEDMESHLQTLQPYHTVTFSIDNGGVKMANCGFMVYSAEPDKALLRTETVNDVSTCIKESMRSTFSMFYVKQIDLLYSGYVNDLLKKK